MTRPPQRLLWPGILIGSAATGIMAIITGFGITGLAYDYVGNPEAASVYNILSVIVEFLFGAWALLFAFCVADFVTGHRRYSISTSDTGNVKAALDDRLSVWIDEEVDRQVTARLSASRLGQAAVASPPSGATHASAAPPGAAEASRRRWQTVWLGIMLGSAAAGIAALLQGVGISTQINEQQGGNGPETFLNAAPVMLGGLACAWAVLVAVFVAHVLLSHARAARRRRTATASR